MKYTAPELLRAAGLFVVTDDALEGARVVDGVAFIGPGADDSELACIAVRIAMPTLDDDGVRAAVAALGYEYRRPAG